MKKILIALDYDPTAQKVAETGYAMARAMKAEVILLHVISDPVYYSSTEYSPIMGFSGYMNMSQLQLYSIDGLINASEQYLDKTKHHLADKSIKIIVKDGDFADKIIETAKEENADIIALGSHSRRWLENILMGSVTTKVLQNSPIPIFIIPTKKKSS